MSDLEKLPASTSRVWTARSGLHRQLAMGAGTDLVIGKETVCVCVYRRRGCEGGEQTARLEREEGPKGVRRRAAGDGRRVAHRRLRGQAGSSAPPPRHRRGMGK
jgi:hypothetical protein